CLGVLDEHCIAIGRDPADITRSSQIIVSYDDATSTRAIIRELIDAGFTHIVLGLPTPYPEGVVRWAVDELIGPTVALWDSGGFVPLARHGSVIFALIGRRTVEVEGRKVHIPVRESLPSRCS